MQVIPWTVCVTPVIEYLGDDKGLFWERCLSLPGLYGQAGRYLRIRFRWTDPMLPIFLAIAPIFLLIVLGHSLRRGEDVQSSSSSEAL